MKPSLCGLIVWFGIFAVSGCSKSSSRSSDGGVRDASDGSMCKAPKRLRFETIGRLTRIDTGWAGTSHGTALNDGTKVTVEITSCDSTCRRCSFRGPIDNSPPSSNNRRCTNNQRVECTGDADCLAVNTCDSARHVCNYASFPVALPTGQFKPCNTDSDCAGTCRYFWGTNLNIGGGLRCSQPYFEPLEESDAPKGTDGAPIVDPIQGSIDFESGEVNMPYYNLGVLSYTVGPSGMPATCPVCSNDSTADDKSLDGTCAQGSPFDGMSCDVGGKSASGPSLHSFDCAAPMQAQFILPLRNVTTRGVVWTMDDSRPNCMVGDGGTKCWCGICNDSARKPCQSNADCRGGATCTATTQADGTPFTTLTQPDRCDVSSCSYNRSTRVGTCMSTFVVPDAGAVVRTINCFPSGQAPNTEFVAAGSTRVVEGAIEATMGAITCFPSSKNIRFDSTGFPGPARMEVAYKITAEF